MARRARQAPALPASSGARSRDTLRFAVPAEADGLRLDQALARLAAGHSRAALQRWIREGHVSVSGRRITRASQPVRGGDDIAIDPPAPAPAVPVAEPLPVDLVYEDRDVVVVDKPAGMVVHPAAGHAGGTLVNALLHLVRDLSGVGGALRPGIVHRLDRGTSGLMVVAKHDAAHQALSRQFHDRQVEKRYTALVWGEVAAGRRVDAPIGRHPTARHKMSTRTARGRGAVTEVVRAEPLGGVSLVEIAIATGRTHQIRVHLNAIGHPVVGDAVYGGARRRLPPHLSALGRLERPFLHASFLAFTHPRDGRRVEFRAGLPEDLAAVLAALRAERAARSS